MGKFVDIPLLVRIGIGLYVAAITHTILTKRQGRGKAVIIAAGKWVVSAGTGTGVRVILVTNLATFTRHSMAPGEGKY